MPGPGWWVVVAVVAVLGAGGAQRTGVGKLLNVFNIVTFPNDACNNGEVYGSCYTGDTQQIFKQSFNNKILNTDNVLTHTQNNINACIPGVQCDNYFVDIAMAHFQHYRRDCYEGPSCEYRKEVVKDARIWRYLDEVMKRTNDARKKINLYS